MKSRRAVNTKSYRSKDAGVHFSSCAYEPVAGMVNRPIPDSLVKREECVGVEAGIPKERAVPWMGKRLH